MTDVRDSFLNECCRRKIAVTVFTTNGFQLKGIIFSFDEAVVMLSQHDGKQAMIYMSAISTIIPIQLAITK
jgi:host factor-I protein